MALYGIIMRWHQYEDWRGEHHPTQDHFFVSPDADRYLEVRGFPPDIDDVCEAYAKELADKLDGKPKGKRVTMPMRYVRRFFVYLREDQEVIFDGRLSPAVTDKDEWRTTGGLPEGTKYPRLAEKAQVKA